MDSVIQRIMQRQELIGAEIQIRLRDSFFPVLVLIGMQIMEKMAVVFKDGLLGNNENRINIFLDIAALASLAVLDLEKPREQPQILPLTSLN